MRILLTNHALSRRAGTELYVRDLALGLLNAGHEPICFSPELGEVAKEIASHGIQTTCDLTAITRPDVIHAHHHNVAALVLSFFPETPALFVCHGVKPWQEAPLARFPNVRKYVAVDEPCREFLAKALHLPSDQIGLVPNGVDLERYSASAPALCDPERQRRALLISNIAQPSDVEPFRQACVANGITLDFAGAQGLVMDRPEKALPQYGIVFAKARAALEAMASGCAVILADYGQTGPLVTVENFTKLRPNNFGFRVIDQSPEVSILSNQIQSIDWQNAANVTSIVRQKAGFSDSVFRYLSLYREISGDISVSTGQSMAAMQSYLATVIPQLAERDDLAGRLYQEVLSRIGRDRSLAACISSVEQDEARWADLLRRAMTLDPENQTLAEQLKKRR